MVDFENFEMGRAIFWKDRNEMAHYIGYWKAIDKIIFAYHLFSRICYDHISIDNFENHFITDKDEIKKYIEGLEQKERDEKRVVCSEKVYQKLENQKWQLDCMKKLNKPIEDIKRGERNIKRQEKKIAHYDERNEDIEEEIYWNHYKMWEDYNFYFGE